MDGLSFIGQLIDSIVWPVTVIIGIFLLRKPISRLIPLLSRFKYKDLNIEFREAVSELKRDAAQFLPTSSKTHAISPDAELENRLVNLSMTSPGQAMLEAWQEVESAAIDRLQASPITFKVGKRPSPKVIEDALQEGNILTGEQLAIFRRLGNIRNTVVVGAKFYIDDVIDFVGLALQMTRYLRATP